MYFVAKTMTIICCFHPITIFICLVGVIVGFVSFAVIGCITYRNN